MSKNSEISKDVDPNLQDEQAAGKASIVDNKVNGHETETDNEGLSKSESNQVSEGESADQPVEVNQPPDATDVTKAKASEAEVDPEVKQDSGATAESDSKPALEAEEAPEANQDAETKTASDSKPEPETVTGSKTTNDPETQHGLEAKADSKTAADSEIGSDPESLADSGTADSSETTDQAEAKVDPEAKADPGAKADTETPTDTDSTTDTTDVLETPAAATQGTEEKDSKGADEADKTTDVKEAKEPPKPWDGLDFKTLDKSELVKIIELLVKEDNPIMADKVSRDLKICYDVIHRDERKQALDKFVAEGNDPDHFAYKFDELDNRFDGAFKLIRDRKSQHIKNLERNKESNLAEKIAMLEELRALVDEEETTSSINSVKKIQEQWKAIGQVPGQHVKTLWANYHALMDRYYDQRSIYFELKELDRKKNLESKLDLCEKVEKLVSLENLKQAISELNEMHEEFKHIGPVPKSEQQSVWERFKHASDQIYARRKEFIKHLKEDLKENLNKKEELAVAVQEYLQFNSDRITDWNKKTKGILELQKKWEAVGGLPREHAKEVNRKFWGAFKGFFHNKGLFFKKLEGERVVNLEKKQELVNKAEELKDSTDWNETAEKLKTLQRDWRNIGPVPEKFRNSIYGKFKEACDTFFNNRRSQNQELEKEYVENLKRKQKICVEIEAMTTGGNHDLDKFLDLKQQFTEIGYVPATQVKQIRVQFSTAAQDFLASVPDDLVDEARQIKYDIQFEKLKKGPHADRRKDQKEQALRRDIGTLENDISTWKNNLEFFANSKTANKLREEFTVKIEQAGKKLGELKSQLRALREL